MAGGAEIVAQQLVGELIFFRLSDKVCSLFAPYHRTFHITISIMMKLESTTAVSLIQHTIIDTSTQEAGVGQLCAIRCCLTWPLKAEFRLDAPTTKAVTAKDLHYGTEM